MTNTNTITKNTIFLFLRMFISMSISLYTSRLLLEFLGFVDYGIYNVVGGIVIFISFLQSSMSSATARFLNIALASGDKANVSVIFNNAIIIHFFLCLVILVIGETVGLYVVINILNFPIERFEAVKIIYQLSLITSCIAVLQIPYYALLIAYEKMRIIAYLGVAQSLLNLLVVYLVQLGLGDNLIIYALMVFVVSLLMRIIYVIYCNKNISESKLVLKFDKEIAKPIISFFSWDLFGNFSVAARGEGVMILLNMFFGVVINASTGIANQVQGLLNSFIDNFLIAIRPQLVQNYARKDYDRMFSLVFIGSKFSFILMFIISLPMYLYMEIILKLWLKNIPAFAVSFCKLILIFTLISVVFRTIMFSIHATGRVRSMSLINGTLYVLILPFSWLALYLGKSPDFVFIISIIFMLSGQISNTFLLKRYINQFNFILFYREVVLRCFIICIVGYFLVRHISVQFSESLISILSVCIISSLLVMLLSFGLGLNNRERNQLIDLVVDKWKKIC